MRLTSSKLTNAALTLLIAAAAVYAAARWLLPWSAPFLLAFAFAALLEPAVAALCRRGFPRPLAAGILLLGTLAAAAGLLFLLLRRLALEVSALSVRLPELAQQLSAALGSWEAALKGWLARAPEGLGLWLDRAVAGAEESLQALPGMVSQRALRFLSGLASSAPGALLFAVTAVIGAYFVSAAYPELLHLAARALPERMLTRARLLRRDLRRTLGRWLRAQGLLLAITFAMLAAAFALLRVDYALLLALATALIDALPVLGSGTVLLPWGLWEIFTGNAPLGVGLVLTYAGVTVVHQSIQAKLLGDQLGLHPLVMLAAIWLGWRVWGVAGMLLFPLLAVCARQALAGVRLRLPWTEDYS